MKILVAYDGSACSEAAVDEVVHRPWPEGTAVRLVTAVERPVLVPSTCAFETYAAFTARMTATFREEAYRRIQAALQRFRDRPDLETSYEIRDGTAKEALLEAIREWRPELVLAGSHGKSAFERFFLGSVSHALVTHAPCSVEIVKTSRAA